MDNDQPWVAILYVGPKDEEYAAVTVPFSTIKKITDRWAEFAIWTDPHELCEAYIRDSFRKGCFYVGDNTYISAYRTIKVMIGDFSPERVAQFEQEN